MREALKRVTLITTYTAAYCIIGAAAWLCGHEVSGERHHL
jgi:hypothetical protein